MLSKTMFHSFFVHSEKAEFDQSMGAFMSRLQTTEAKLSATLFNDIPIAAGVIC